MALNKNIMGQLRLTSKKTLPGKIVASYIYYGTDGSSIKWDVRVCKEGQLLKDNYDNYDTLHFLAFKVAGSGEVLVVGSDIEEVRREAERQFKEKCGVVWTSKILIQMSTDENRWRENVDSRALEFGYNYVQVGITSSGATVYKSRSHPTTEQAPTGTMIDDTEENREKMQSIIKAFNLLGERLESLLSPKNVEATLANVKLLGLPAPKDV